jgi:hypothetical protein
VLEHLATTSLGFVSHPETRRDNNFHTALSGVIGRKEDLKIKHAGQKLSCSRVSLPGSLVSEDEHNQADCFLGNATFAAFGARPTEEISCTKYEMTCRNRNFPSKDEYFGLTIVARSSRLHSYTYRSVQAVALLDVPRE